MKTLTGTGFLCIFVLAAVIGIFLCLPFFFLLFSRTDSYTCVLPYLFNGIIFLNIQCIFTCNTSTFNIIKNNQNQIQPSKPKTVFVIT